MLSRVSRKNVLPLSLIFRAINADIKRVFIVGSLDTSERSVSSTSVKRNYDMNMKVERVRNLHDVTRTRCIRISTRWRDKIKLKNAFQLTCTLRCSSLLLGKLLSIVTEVDAQLKSETGSP